MILSPPSTGEFIRPTVRVELNRLSAKKALREATGRRDEFAFEGGDEGGAHAGVDKVCTIIADTFVFCFLIHKYGEGLREGA